MAIMKSKDEIGVYIKDRLKQIGLSQSDLAGKIAELKGDGYDKNSLKDNVSKWIRGARYPGTEYIYYLAQVLRVSIEEILVAGEVCDKYDDRPFTLYAIAKSGNRDAVDTVMAMQDEYGSCVGTNYDEYDKTLLDYIIQFENLDLLTSGDSGDNQKLMFKTIKRGHDLDLTKENLSVADITEEGLRYDLTVPLVRCFANNREKLPFPFKSIQIDEAFRAVSGFFQKPDAYRRDQRRPLQTDDAFVRNTRLLVQIRFPHRIEYSYSSLPPFASIIPKGNGMFNAKNKRICPFHTARQVIFGEAACQAASPSGSCTILCNHC